MASTPREGGGATDEDKDRQAKEQIWNKVEVREATCVCVCAWVCGELVSEWVLVKGSQHMYMLTVYK